MNCAGGADVWCVPGAEMRVSARDLRGFMRRGLLFVLALAGCEGGDAPVPSPLAPPSTERDAARVYYVGHSLLDHRDSTAVEGENVMSLVGRFAERFEKRYAFYAHTLIGAPLSLNHEGASVSTGQSDPRAHEHMRELAGHAERYDTFVLTESVPLDGALRGEHTHYFAQRFYCEANARRAAALGPSATPAEHFVYEGWHHLYASDPDGRYGSPARWDFGARVRADREKWSGIARAMTGPRLAGPGLGARLRASFSGADREACPRGMRVRVIPAGTALAALQSRLRAARAEDDAFRTLDGRALVMGDFFENGYLDWPERWPLSAQEAARVDVEEVIRTRTRVHPDRPPDDIHLGQLGIYYVALVTYATVYRSEPVAPPLVQGVSPELARALAELAWSVVKHDPRTGLVREGAP